MKKILLILLLMFASAEPAFAQVVHPLHNVESSSTKQFIVSGVLRRDSAPGTIKLAHGVQVSRSREEAILGFANELLAQYPEYTLIEALADPIPSRPTSRGRSI